MMSADRENHGMTQHDIALLLADAADEVEIGIAPTQALIRGGRRRKARRWAVAGAAALVVAGSTGALAVSGLPGDEERGLPAVRPSVAYTLPAFGPHGRVTLATGTDGGKPWTVSLDLWDAPVDTADAQATLNAMAQYGEYPADISTAADLVGNIAYFVSRTTGHEYRTTPVTQNVVPEGDTLSGTDVMASAVSLFPDEDVSPRLVIGHVAKTARQVTCTWKDGTTTVVERAASDDVNSDELVIRDPAGSPYSWFVCLAPQGTAYKSVEVTGQASG